jgi:hypothetical protein
VSLADALGVRLLLAVRQTLVRVELELGHPAFAGRATESGQLHEARLEPSPARKFISRHFKHWHLNSGSRRHRCQQLGHLKCPSY